MDEKKKDLTPKQLADADAQATAKAGNAYPVKAAPAKPKKPK